MSEKTDKRTSRRLRYRRLRHPRNERRGVSPVVATLILILIAVAAAAALYLWLVGWQGSVTGSISKPGVNQGSFTMGGSTSVYPFSSLAVSWYEQNNTGVSISDTQGGTTAGMLSVCAGGVDVGTASAPFTAATLIANDGCPASDASTITVTTLAYDAVDVIVPSANTHGLLSINYDTLALVYADATVTAGGAPKLIPTAIDGELITTLNTGSAAPVPTPTTGTLPLDWNQIPAAVVGGVVGSVGTEAIDTHSPAVVAAGGAPCASPFASDICDLTSATGTPCGFIICASGAVAIHTVARSDGSGTTQAFEARLLDAKNSNTFAAQSDLVSALTGFSGCGGNNLISDCGYISTEVGNGNPGVISAVAADANSIGYASDGLARASGSGVGLIAFTGVGQSASTDNSQATWYGGILPTTGGSGTIAAGINSQTNSALYVTGYLGWRPFDFVTLAPPTGIVADFIHFVQETGVNTELATVTAEVSLYSV